MNGLDGTRQRGYNISFHLECGGGAGALSIYDAGSGVTEGKWELAGRGERGTLAFLRGRGREGTCPTTLQPPTLPTENTTLPLRTIAFLSFSFFSPSASPAPPAGRAMALS